MKKLCRSVIFEVTFLVMTGTCIRMYLMKVRLFQRPISCIVSTGTPARNMAMAAPDLMECVLTLSPPIVATACLSF